MSDSTKVGLKKVEVSGYIRQRASTPQEGGCLRRAEELSE